MPTWWRPPAIAPIHAQGCRRLHFILRRGGHPRRAGCDPAAGRQRLHQRLSDRALLRDAKLYEIGAGTSEIRRMLIGRELFGEG
jgi:alkylation response protein AidB-like acyl-CoA dehydrogenase